jgi:hypothetical protein
MMKIFGFIPVPHLSNVKARWLRRILVIVLLPYELGNAWYTVIYWAVHHWRRP